MIEPAALTFPIRKEQREELLPMLFARQLMLYTGSESSSLPLEAARDLLHGLRISLAAVEELWTGFSPDELLAHAAQCVRERTEQTLVLWQKTLRSMPRAALENRALRDTLRSIGRGFRHYDARFFPQYFPCEIDYPLAFPLPEGREGIFYINDYLTQLAAEGELLARLPGRALRCVWERCCGDRRELVVDLYAPAVSGALARTLLGSGAELTLTDGEVERLRLRWEHQTPEQIERSLLLAADALARSASLSPSAADLLRRSARESAQRAAALRDCGGLRGIFA